jgi:hypothetical protein
MLPDVRLSIQDGSLGILPEATDGLSVKLGACSLGEVGTIYSFANKADLVATLGVGPLVEAAAYHLDVSGQPVLCVPVEVATEGVASAVTKTGDGTGTMTVAGDALDAYEVLVEITRAGTNLVAATAAFKYSLDGGDTYSKEIAVPTGADYVIPGTGLTLTFVNGGSGTSFAVGDVHSFTTTPPSFGLTEISDALDALLADSREWGFVHIVGEASAAIAAGVATKMTAAESSFRYAFALLEAADQAADDTEDEWMTDLQTDFANTADGRLEVAAGHLELVSAITGRIHRRSCAWVVAARIARAPISEDLGRVASGPVPGVVKLHHDEQVKPGLDAARFTTMRTIIGLSGFFISGGRMMAAEGSDFSLVQRRRILDRACKIARNAYLRFLNDQVDVKANGTIEEAPARAIEAFVTEQLRAGLVSSSPRHASAASSTIDRAFNVQAAEKLKATVTVRPPGYARDIDVSIGFESPALAAAAQ